MDRTPDSTSDSRLSTEDPVVLLKNEHTRLLGQIQLLESHDVTIDQASTVLKTILRDSQVHFKREAIVFEALGPKLGTGGESLQALKNEHIELGQTASALLRAITQLNNRSELWEEAHLRPQLRRLTKQFRAHIQHEEKVVYVLVRTRLSSEHQRRVAKKMLAE